MNKDFILGALLGAATLWAINNPEKLSGIQKEVEEKIKEFLPNQDKNKENRPLMSENKRSRLMG